MMNINEVRNSFEQELINSGYKTFKSYLNKSLRGFQKKYKDTKGIKYFLNCYHYNHGEQIPHSSAPNENSYHWEAQFNIGKNVVDINFGGIFIPDGWGNSLTTLKEVEDFYEQFFIKFNCDYYEKEN